MKIAGIDFSYTSPAICVGDEGCVFGDLKFYAFRQKKKQMSQKDSIVLLEYPLWESQEERFELLTNMIIDVITSNSVEKVFLEGYAYASSKGLVFDIAECTGILKNKLWKAGIEFDLLPPAMVKKVATGKGNSGKDMMLEYFLMKCDFCVSTVLGLDAVGKPMDDIIDSYWVREAGIAKMKTGS